MKDKKVTNISVCLTTIFIIIALTIFTKYDQFGINFDDFGWHIKVGEYILTNHTIPNTGIFSWSASNRPWISHEWLSETIFAIIGDPILIVTIFSIIFIICICAYFSFYMKNTGTILYMLFLIINLFILLSLRFNSARPQIFMCFLFFIMLVILYEFRKGKRHIIWGLPILAILWANLHGGSSMLVYIVPLFLIITSLFNYSLSRLQFKKLDKKDLLCLISSTVLSIGTLCINPHGYKILLYPYTNASDALMQKYIVEWYNPDFKNIATLFFFAGVIYVAVMLIISKKQIYAFDLLLYAFTVYLSLRSLRFLDVAIIVSLFLFFNYTSLQYSSKIIKNKYIYMGGAILTSIMCIVILVMFTPKIEIQKSKDTINDTAINEIKKYNPQRLFNDYGLGSQLIYNDIGVFIDGRADLYTNQYSEENIFYDYELMSTGIMSDDEWHIAETIDKYNFDMFICNKNLLTQVYLKNNSNRYKMIYSDETVDIFIDTTQLQPIT